MKTIRTAVAAAALVAALAACGTPVTGTPEAQPASQPASQPTPQSDPFADQRAIETMFQDYYRALQAQDFATACGYTAQETTDQLLANLRSRGIEAATCEEAMTAVYAIPQNARVVEQVAETARIENVTVNGDQATLNWSSEVDGNRSPGTTQLRRVDGRWLLASTGA
jgi:hypothetical protein